MMTSVGPAHAAIPEPISSLPPTVAIPPAVDPLANVDTEALSQAADSFTPGSASDAAALAEATTTEDAVPVELSPDGGMAAETDTGTVEIAKSGDVTVSADGMPDIGIAIAGDPDTVKIVDGAVVQTGVATDTDLVVRATDDGVQMVAVLGTEDAPTDIDFDLDLPESAKLIEQADGSIVVVATVEVETITPESAEQLVASINAVLGDDYDGTSELTPEQEALVASIPEPELTTVTQEQQVAEIGAPWAVDANGDVLETHYELTADGIRQVIETDENTAFPVTADPWWSWLAGAAQAVFSATNPIGISNFAFAVKLGAWVKATTLATKGHCRYEASWPIEVCWGGKLTMLDGYGGGTTYGTTYYADKDPKLNKTPAVYKDRLNHEWRHTLQWKSLGLGMAGSYLLSEGIGRGITGGKAGCGNIFEIMADLKKGGYKC